MKRIVFVLFATTLLNAPAWGDDWPQWRGPNRTGISQEKGLLKEWPADGPAIRWKAMDIGTGYSAPSIAAGKVFLQTTKGNDELAMALNEKDGKTLWSTPIGKVGKNNGPQYPGTRATPTVDGEHLYCLASDSELTCLTTAGEVVWQKNLMKEFDGKVGNWAYTESLLVDGDLVICTPGGSKATLAALNKKTGDTVWKAAVPDGDVADYASIMAVEVDKKKQYVQFLRKGVVGVDAKTGAFLWRYNKTVDMGANILTPVIQNNLVFTAGSRTGGGLVELKADGAGTKASEVYFEKAVAPSIGGAVLVEGHLYGTTSNGMFCADFATGKVKWTERGVGAASVCYADGHIYVRGHGNEIALVEANPTAYKEKGRFKQPERSKIQAWPHPVLANGALYLRDSTVLLCFDVKAK